MADLTKDQVRKIIANAPPGSSPASIIDGLIARGHRLEGYGSTAASSPSSGGFGGFPSGVNPMNPAGSLGTMIRGRAVEALPALGGLAGGMLGSFGGVPGAITGAGVGGALGEAGRERFGGQPLSARDIGLAGAGQGAMEATGIGLAKGAGALAVPLMRRALGVGKALPGAPFGDVAKTALAEGVGVSPRALAKVDRLRSGSAQVLADMLDQARASGQMLNTRAVTQNVRTLLRSNVIPVEEKADVTQRLLSFLSDKTARIDPVTLKEIKQFWQNRARSAYATAPGVMREALPPQARFAEQLASGAQQQLERIQGVGAREARTQSLIGLQQAVEKAYQRPPRALQIFHPGSYPAPFLNSPRALSNYALFLNHPAFKAFARQFPRAAAALVFHGAEPDATSQ